MRMDEKNKKTNEEQPEETSEDLFDMEPAELVLRQQLNVAHYWAGRQRAKLSGTSLNDQKGSEPSDLPGQWTLLKGLELRDWQKGCIDKWFTAGKRGVVKVVTGAGKTVMACGIVERLQNTEASGLRVAVVVPTIVLLDQWYELLANHSNLPAEAVGRLGGGFQESFDGSVRILVCVLNSAAAKLPGLAANLKDPLLLIVDECHRAGASEMSKIFKARRAYNLGLSATPEREKEAVDDEEAAVVDQEPEETENFDDSLLGQELGPIIYELGYLEALNDDILAKFQIQHYGLPLEPGERVKYDRMSREITDLRRSLQSQVKKRGMDGGALVGWARRVASRGGSALASQAAQYVALTGHRKHLVYHAKSRAMAVERLVAEALAQATDTRILLFHESIAEVMRIFTLLRQKGFPVVAEHSQLTDSLRAESLHVFRIGAAQVLVSARSLIEGFDVPAADVGIVVASSSSVRQRIQTLGRILRKKTNEERAAVLHVLYVAETTDEMIYEKQDWAVITGAERNSYFVWDPTLPDARPIGKDGPPRTPKPTEDKIDWDSLSVGTAYPGSYDGTEFSSDSQGNIKDTEGRISSNPQEIPSRIQEARGSYGRFRVTPRKQAILAPGGEKGCILFLGFLQEPFVFSDRTESDHSENAIELLVRSKAGGYRITRKISDGEAFARIGDHAKDKSRAAEAETLAKRVKETEKETGKTIRKLKLHGNGDVVAVVNGEQIVLLKLTAGLEFADRNLP
jgi:superfamily II DNA or RNA helicase